MKNAIEETNIGLDTTVATDQDLEDLDHRKGQGEEIQQLPDLSLLKKPIKAQQTLPPQQKIVANIKRPFNQSTGNT